MGFISWAKLRRMNRRRRWALLLGVLLALAFAGYSSAAGGQVVWKNYGKPVLVEPERVDITYSTGFAWADHLTEWTGWGSKRAVADGRIHLNTCKPFCAAGNYKAYDGTVVLSKIRGCNGQRRYLDVKVVPKGQPAAAWGSNCKGLQIAAP